MITSEAKKQFNVVLSKQHLADVRSSFGDPDFFDEVPLYSRYSQVEFLKQYGDVDLLLLELACEYLQRVTDEIRIRKAKRFIAITVIRDDEAEFIVPSIFVCNGAVKKRLKELHLSRPSQGLGKRTEGLLRKAKLNGIFDALEDRATVPDDVRVFVSYRSPPEGLLALSIFANGVVAQTINRRP